MMRIMSTAFGAFVIAAAIRSPASAETAAFQLPDGVWNVAAHGAVFGSDRRSAQVFHLSSSGCARGDDQRHRESPGQVGAPALPAAAERLVLQSGPTRYPVERLQSSPQSCLKPVRTRDSMISFAASASSFDDLYPAIDERRVDWANANCTIDGGALEGRGVIADKATPPPDNPSPSDLGEKEIGQAVRRREDAERQRSNCWAGNSRRMTTGFGGAWPQAGAGE